MLAEPLDNPAKKPSHTMLPKWEIRGSDFAIFVAFLFSSMGLVSLIFQNVAAKFLVTDPDAPMPLLVSLSANLGMQFGMLASFLVFRKIIQHQDFTPPPHRRYSPTKSMQVGLKWLIMAYPIMIGINLLSRTILNLLGFEQVIQDPIRMVQEGGTTFELFAMYAMIVAVAPICEEVAFRGGIFRYLHHRVPLYASLGLSAFFFALLHANLYSFAPLMTIGVMLALAYRESGSLISCFTFHAAFNSINLALILLFPEMS
ncbi:type II CAAX endopeptidase family protein [Pelagicoccus mobilis]|uniref:CPBP family intramembrane metalloprotease n=1 Tax=Pelagicoccus mobilis TaxID=415221 RepID=A0A934S2P6_9BACT|nr:type II CAAX endopeptidase family protein [Pelagicoccus mobilis]MBK1879989.1 CPBP family intramembrane metalloprotease [Pelagicoccus mobilis]